MATYYLHLGYDWNSYQVGTVWGEEGTNNPNYWLQYCLATNETANQDEPYWNGALFQFNQNDIIYIKIWDLTDYSSLSTSYPLTVNTAGYSGIGVCTLGGTVYTRTNSPVSVGSNLVWATEKNMKSYLEFNSIALSGGKSPQQSPWGQSMYASSNSINLTISQGGNQSFKMSFRLNVGYTTDGITYSSWKTFIADPETAIGSGREF